MMVPRVPPAENLAAVRQIPLFSGLSDPQSVTLASRMQRQAYQAGDVIFRKGDLGSALFFITQGLVKIAMPEDEAQEAVLDLLRDGEFFGEMALIDGQPRSATASAMIATDTLSLSRDEFLTFLDDQPQAAISIIAVLGQRMRHTDDQIADSIFRDVTTRIAKKILELADDLGEDTGHGIAVNLRLRQQDIANMVGAARESVNRCMIRLEERGLLKVERGRVTIVDSAGRREWAS